MLTIRTITFGMKYLKNYMNKKTCFKCKLIKNYDCFYTDKRHLDGLKSDCKECFKQISKEQYKSSKKHVYYIQNQEKILINRKDNLIINREKFLKRKLKSPEKYLLIHAKSRAKKRNLDFDISIEDVKIPEKCPVLGILLVFSLNKRTNNTPSIDRIDSSKGYIKGNVIVVSWRANMLKNNGTWQEHQQIADYYKGIIK